MTKEIDADVLTKAVLRAAERLGLTPAELGQTLDLDEAIVSQLTQRTHRLQSDSKAWERAVMLVRIHEAVMHLLAGDQVAARAWMRSLNTELHAAPIDRIGNASGLVDVMNYVESRRARL